MSENLQTFTRALNTLRSVANRVPTDAWDNRTCCSDWTAREVAGHASWVVQAIGAIASGGEPPAQQPEAEVAGADPAATVRASVDGTLAALDHPGVLNTVRETPFGEMPVDDFIGGIHVDSLLHAWDIADATGIDPGIDPGMAAAGRRALEPIAPMLRGPGRFDDAIETDDADPLAQLIAFAGRRSVNS